MPLLRRCLSVPALLLVLLATIPVAPAAAQDGPTRLRVRVVAHDAKLIGSGVGGARVTIRDAASGRVLASGVQEGATGSTDAIVREPVVRGGTVFDTEGAAFYQADLAIREPTVVEVSAEGPLGTEHAVQRASKTVLMVPGVDVVGEGLVLELNGFTVDLLDVQQGDDAALNVRARVTMLCGCPTEPGGLWDASRIRVVARLVRDGDVAVETPLDFAGQTSTYEGALEAPSGGRWELQVLALDPTRANTGMVRRAVTVN
jgi:hypothetical protein